MARHIVTCDRGERPVPQTCFFSKFAVTKSVAQVLTVQVCCTHLRYATPPRRTTEMTTGFRQHHRMDARPVPARRPGRETRAAISFPSRIAGDAGACAQNPSPA